MDEVNINKYLSQFNPILIVPVLSAVVGAILVFVFGFKRPNEPRFQSNSSIDSLKKSKRKANTAKSSDNVVQTSKQQNVQSSTKVSAGKKATPDSSNAATGKKTTNNNNSINNNNNISKKKTDEKKSENISPAKKLANKKNSKESAVAANKKSKANKNSVEGNHDEKPADFDDGNWFTVQSKGKQKNKVDDLSGNQAENVSPKVQTTKINKQAKGAKAEIKPQLTSQAIGNELNNVSTDLQQSNFEPNEGTNIELKNNDIPLDTAKPAIVPEEPVVVASSNGFEVVVEKKATTPVSTEAADVNVIVDNAIAFDELGEWTDAKPDRKRGNKKKSRKD